MRGHASSGHPRPSRGYDPGLKNVKWPFPTCDCAEFGPCRGPVRDEATPQDQAVGIRLYRCRYHKGAAC